MHRDPTVHGLRRGGPPGGVVPGFEVVGRGGDGVEWGDREVRRQGEKERVRGEWRARV